MKRVLRLLATLAALVTAALAAGCGGSMEAGVGSGGSGAPPTSFSVSSGPVTGFGSIIVNGERYDETGAQIWVDERPDQLTPATVDAIRLGAQVELEHRALVVSKATATAELIGPVTSVSASSFIALGQTVRIDSDPARPTVFEGLTGLVDLASGAIVEVHGQRNSQDHILATRVELRPSALPLVRLAGNVAGLNGRVFTIGGLSIDTGSAALVPGGSTLANGQRVVVWTDVPYTGGTLLPKVVRIGALPIPAAATVILDGVVASLQSPASFRLGGVLVDASGAQFVDGTIADLANGRAVRVRGTFTGSIVLASSVEFLQGQDAQVQLTGPVAAFADADEPFRIRNAVVRVTPQTTYVGGAAANLGNGVQVRVDGTLVNGVVQALRLEFLSAPAGVQRVVFGRVIGAVMTAANGTRTFRVDALAVDVVTTPTTSFSKGTPAELAAGRELKLKGTLQTAQFVADDIQFMDNPADPPTFDIEGVASNVQAASLVVNGTIVRLTGSTAYTVNGAPGAFTDLKNGLQVEIVATRPMGVLTALSIDIQEAASGPATVRGLVSGRASPTALEFMVGTQRVSVAGNPQVVPGNRTIADIRNGDDLEVRGTISAGVLHATRVKFR